MKSENKYIGDDKFKKFLEHYDCAAPLEVIKLRFAGAVCSPNTDLRPTDVISSLWPENKEPRLETKNEADLFFKFFMGLWDEMFHAVEENRLNLSPINQDDDIKNVCQNRFEQVELGFVEGFFGGQENLKIPAYIAEVVDSLSRMALLYQSIAKMADEAQKRQNVLDAVKDCDKTVTKSLAFIVENYALPHIDSLRRTVQKGDKNGYN